jgi:hypothetical protein
VDAPESWRELWAMAHDEGWAHSTFDFGKMTIGQLRLLLKRGQAKHRLNSYYAGIVASTYVNTKLAPGKEPISPYDFVPRDEVEDPQKTIRDAAKKNLFGMVCMLLDKKMMPTDPTAVEALRLRSVASLREQGVADPEELFEEVFRLKVKPAHAVQ